MSEYNEPDLQGKRPENYSASAAIFAVCMLAAAIIICHVAGLF
jgi:hypothetical protein